MLAYIFLARNGHRIIADEASATRAVLDLAAGAMTEQAFTHWLADNVSADAGTKPETR